jgi:hypothetical protein
MAQRAGTPYANLTRNPPAYTHPHPRERGFVTPKHQQIVTLCLGHTRPYTNTPTPTSNYNCWSDTANRPPARSPRAYMPSGANQAQDQLSLCV